MLRVQPEGPFYLIAGLRRHARARRRGDAGRLGHEGRVPGPARLRTRPPEAMLVHSGQEEGGLPRRLEESLRPVHEHHQHGSSSTAWRRWRQKHRDHGRVPSRRCTAVTLYFDAAITKGRTGTLSHLWRPYVLGPSRPRRDGRTSTCHARPSPRYSSRQPQSFQEPPRDPLSFTSAGYGSCTGSKGRPRPQLPFRAAGGGRPGRRVAHRGRARRRDAARDRVR